MTIKRFLPSILIFSAVFVTSCTHDPITTDINWDLYEMAQETKGFTWFKFSNASLPKSSGSGHSEPFLRTRFNGLATTKLDSSGRVIPGAVFPEGALIVKELLKSDDSLERYAILLKDSENEFADSKGWVWGYVSAGGSVSESAENKGKACIGCHSQTENIDYTLMNKFYP
jgi:hypothetical protein